MERIRQKIGRLREYLVIIDSLKDDCPEKIVTDRIFRGALLYHLYLAADTCVTLAEMVIKERNLRPPQSYTEAIDILGEQGIIEQAFAHQFARIAGLRNILAHDYEKLDHHLVCQHVLKFNPEIKTFIAQIEHSLNL
jgi:uncharacterized protein YutE (UPF0331/DUF86 family)